MSEQEDQTLYKVVVNHEEQYSIWPADRENALGWRDDGFRGTKAVALAYIKDHWTDMRPLSLRMQMENARQPAATASNPVAATATSSDVASAVSVAVADEPPASHVAPVAASATPEPALTPPSLDTKQKRGWFGRRRNDETAVGDANLVSVGSAPATDTQQKRGWFGKRRTN